MKHETRSRKLIHGFTLLELLITLGIISILTGTLLTVLNPVELLKKARDTRRIQDLDSIHNALLLYLTEIPAGSFGSTTTVSVSVPDTSGTCANLGLPTLPTGFTYRCVTSANLQKTDGTGWVPVNFGALSATIGSNPLPYLPIDPQNTTSTGAYYTYVPGGSWEMTAGMEAAVNQGSTSVAGKDGGSHNNTYEKGTNLALTPTSLLARSERSSLQSGLVGWWTFDEGTGTTAKDYSGSSNAGTWNGTGTHYTVGKTGPYAGQFNGVDDYTNIGDPVSGILDFGTQSFSFGMWLLFDANGDVSGNWQLPLFKGGSQYSVAGYDFEFYEVDNKIYANISDGSGLSSGYGQAYYSYNFRDGLWHQIYGVVDRQANTIVLYVDGTQRMQTSIATVGNSSNTSSLSVSRSGTFFDGNADDVRVYNRALSATEVQASYNATR